MFSKICSQLLQVFVILFSYFLAIPGDLHRWGEKNSQKKIQGTAHSLFCFVISSVACFVFPDHIPGIICVVPVLNLGQNLFFFPFLFSTVGDRLATWYAPTVQTHGEVLLKVQSKQDNRKDILLVSLYKVRFKGKSGKESRLKKNNSNNKKIPNKKTH